MVSLMVLILLTGTVMDVKNSISSSEVCTRVMALRAAFKAATSLMRPSILLVLRLVQGTEKLLRDHGLPLAVVAHCEIDETVLGLIDRNRSRRIRVCYRDG